MAAWAASTPITSLEPVWLTDTAMACVTPLAAAMAPAAPGSSGAGGSTWTSPPLVKAAWSEADLSQLACCASASVPVATAMVSSSAAPPWRTGIRLSRQEASEAVSLLPRTASQSAVLAARGSKRSVATLPAASASAGASASTGSIPTVPPPLAAE